MKKMFVLTFVAAFASMALLSNAQNNGNLKDKAGIATDTTKAKDKDKKAKPAVAADTTKHQK